MDKPAHVLSYQLDVRTARRALDVLQADAQLGNCVRTYDHMGRSVILASATFPVATAAVGRGGEYERVDSGALGACCTSALAMCCKTKCFFFLTCVKNTSRGRLLRQLRTQHATAVLIPHQAVDKVLNRVNNRLTIVDGVLSASVVAPPVVVRLPTADGVTMLLKIREEDEHGTQSAREL